MKSFITSCTRKTTNWYFKRCISNVAVWTGTEKSTGKLNVLWRYVLKKQVTLHFKRAFEKSTGKNYGKMKCFITSCTRKASNVVFQTFRFEKERENAMFYNVMH
jgi:hypothetical protein